MKNMYIKERIRILKKLNNWTLDRITGLIEYRGNSIGITEAREVWLTFIRHGYYIDHFYIKKNKEYVLNQAEIEIINAYKKARSLFMDFYFVKKNKNWVEKSDKETKNYFLIKIRKEMKKSRQSELFFLETNI